MFRRGLLRILLIMPLSNFYKILLIACTVIPILEACQSSKQINPRTSFTIGRATQPISGKKHMIAVAHPMAAQAGREILRRGGNALDAAITAELVLSLVEPQSSGIGGGAFLVYYEKKTGAIDTYDGRETAPKSANPSMFLDGKGNPIKWHDASIGGLGVGVPGLLKMLELS